MKSFQNIVALAFALLAVANAAVVSSNVVPTLSTSAIRSPTISASSSAVATSTAAAGGFVIEGVYTTCLDFTFAAPTSTATAVPTSSLVIPSVSAVQPRAIATSITVSEAPTAISSIETPTAISSIETPTAISSIETPTAISSIETPTAIPSSSEIPTATASAVVVFHTCLVFLPPQASESPIGVGSATSVAVPVATTSA